LWSIQFAIEMGGKHDGQQCCPKIRGPHVYKRLWQYTGVTESSKLAGRLIEVEVKMSRYGQIPRGGFPGGADSSTTRRV